MCVSLDEGRDRFSGFVFIETDDLVGAMRFGPFCIMGSRNGRMLFLLVANRVWEYIAKAGHVETIVCTISHIEFFVRDH